MRFIDIERNAVQTIQVNLEHTGLGSGAEVLRSNAFRFLERPVDRAFDYVYIAPPQYKGIWKRALLVLDTHLGWLSQDAWAIVQIDPNEYQEVQLNNLVLFDQRRYGSTLLVFYERLVG